MVGTALRLNTSSDSQIKSKAVGIKLVFGESTRPDQKVREYVSFEAILKKGQSVYGCDRPVGVNLS